MNRQIERRCRACGKGTIRPERKAGREWSFQGLSLVVPADFEVPTCDHCGEAWLDPDRAEALDDLLERQYQERLHARLQDAISIISHHRSQRALEQLLGLSQGYLSHVLSGRKTPSTQLVLTLVLIARDPDVRIPELEEALGLRPPRWMSRRTNPPALTSRAADRPARGKSKS